MPFAAWSCPDNLKFPMPAAVIMATADATVSISVVVLCVGGCALVRSVGSGHARAGAVFYLVIVLYGTLGVRQ